MSTSTFSVASVNVNGIRAAYRKGMAEWVEQANPDVLLLQEVRAEEPIAAALITDRFDTFVAPSQIKGRAGVAVAIRKDSAAVGLAADQTHLIGLSEVEEPIDSGRWIEVDLETASGDPVRVVSAYFHSGVINDPKQDAKMRHLEAIDGRLQRFLADRAEGGPEVILAGDFNVVRSQLDIKNWKGNYNKASGVLDEEMIYLNRWVSEGWVDVVRDLYGDLPGPYSWWSQRGKAYDNDTGWRIDYQYVTKTLAERALRHRIDRAPSYDTRWSDHAPVTVEFML